MRIKTYDDGEFELDFNPNQYKSRSGAAKALYKALCKVAASWGMTPEIEVRIFSPADSKAMGYGENWRVCWESGPYEWAIPASFAITNDKEGWYTEPYYSFDLCFAR